LSERERDVICLLVVNNGKRSAIMFLVRLDRKSCTAIDFTAESQLLNNITAATPGPTLPAVTRTLTLPHHRSLPLYGLNTWKEGRKEGKEGGRPLSSKLYVRDSRAYRKTKRKTITFEVQYKNCYIGILHN
jgi:hypothetical protein